MKERELRQHCDCSICKRPIGKTGVPLFYRVKVERFGIKLDAVRRQAGLTAMLGGCAGLAMVMGPDEEMAVPMMRPITLTVCEDCSFERCILGIATEIAGRVDDTNIEAAVACGGVA